MLSDTTTKVVTVVEKYNIDIHALQSFGLSRGAMRLKDKWSTHHMVPDEMHIALASNIHASVDWRLTVFWVAFLEFYQAQTKADAIENEQVQLRGLVKQKEQKVQMDLCVRLAKKARKNDIVEEKAAMHAKQKSDKAVLTAADALIEIRNKLEYLKKKLVSSEEVYTNANTEKRKSAAASVVEKHKARICLYTDLELQKFNNNANIMSKAVGIWETLAEKQAHLNSTQNDDGPVKINDAASESVEKIQMCPDTLSITLQYYKNRLRLENSKRRSPTLEELDDQWRLVVDFISDGTKTAMMTIGCAIWRACFDRLFSYEAEKALYEETHFGITDDASYVQITSGNAFLVLSASRTESICCAIFWGLPNPGTGKALLLYSLADFYALNIAR